MLAAVRLYNLTSRREARRFAESVEGRQIPMQNLDLEDVGPGLEQRAQIVGVAFAKLGIAARGPQTRQTTVHPQMVVEPGGQAQLGFLGNAPQIEGSSETDAIHAAALPTGCILGPDPVRPRHAGAVWRGA